VSEEQLSVEGIRIKKRMLEPYLSAALTTENDKKDDVARCHRKGEVSSLAFAVSRALLKYLLANGGYPCILPVNTSGVNKGQNEPDNRSNGIEKS